MESTSESPVLNCEMIIQGQRSNPLWTPPSNVSHLPVEKFRRFVNNRKNVQLSSYDELQAWSVKHLNEFWMLHWEFVSPLCSSQPTMIIDEKAPLESLPAFFRGATLNFAQNILDQNRQGTAIKAFSELQTEGAFQAVSWYELRQRVKATADALYASEVRENDVVAYIGSNTPDAAVVLLAAASIGAIFTSLAGDMGEKAVLDRLLQIKPKILFAVDGYQYNGKQHDIRARVNRVVDSLSSCELIVVPNLPKRHVTKAPTPARVPPTAFASFLQRARPREREFVQLPYSHPIFILFSSGTTGAPKGIVHCHGGVTLNLKSEHMMYEDLSTGDVYYHYSNIGWTMWNIFLGGLLTGASIVMYDGSPFFPNPAAHIKHVLSLGTTVYGGSPRYYTELRDRGIRPSQIAGIEQIRLMGSSGAILSAPMWQWIANQFGNPPILSFSGGTDMCGALIHGSLVHPHYAGEITVKKLGFDVDIFDEDGRSARPGDAGELVIKRPFPSAPITLWNDPTFSRFRSSYFERFPGVWAHGDYARVNPVTGGMLILGRSDGVLNPSGVRFGASEIYAVVETFRDSIHDSLCVGRNNANAEEEVLLFVQTKPGIAFTPDLEKRLRNKIAASLSLRHVPRYIYSIPRIPYNVNGKKLEVAVKKVLSGSDISAKMRTTLINPTDLDIFKNYAVTSTRSSKL